MMSRLVELCGLAFAIAVGASAVGAQQKALAPSHKPGRILGVFDNESGLPIPDAEVMDLFADGVARTESHGLVELSQFNSRNDSAAVRIRKVGFADTAFVVMVGAADTVPMQVNMRKAGVALPTVTVNASANTLMGRRLQEFEDRKKVGMGKYITADELRRNDGRNIRDILIEHGMEKAPGCQGNVRPQYILNGVPNTSAADVELALRDNGDNFAAVEFYSDGATPTQFQGTNVPKHCGTVILWTRF